MCFRNMSVFIYLFIVVIICWDLNIVLMEYSPIVKSFTYICLWRQLIARDIFFFNRLYKLKHFLNIVFIFCCILNIFRFKFSLSHVLTGDC